MTNFVQRELTATITLGVGQFGNNKGNAVTLKGYRMQASLTAYGGSASGALQLRIYGLTPDMMNQLTCIGPIEQQRRTQNVVTLSAGNTGSKPTLVFTGMIDSAWGDYQSAPDISLNITAYAAAALAVIPVPHISFNGPTDINILGNAIVAGVNSVVPAMGLTFVNSGPVTGTITNPALGGSALDQIRECAKALNFQYKVELNTLTIWSYNVGIPPAGAVPYISPQTGLVGYPKFTQSGIAIKTLFLSTVAQGSRVQVQSSITPACAVWNVISVVHTLESLTPGGAWFTDITGTKAPN